LLAFAPTFSAPAPLSDACQVFYANEGMGIGSYGLLADDVIRIQLQPSLSLAKGDTAPGGAASAFLLKSLTQACVMVRLLTYLLSTVELGCASRGGHGGQIAQADIDSYHLMYRYRCWITYLDRVRDE
jgi:hypothetical protein